MDTNDFWQENKRLIVTLACGLLVYLIAGIIVESAYGSDLTSARRELNSNKTALSEDRYSPTERNLARDENDGLREALVSLAETVAFTPRSRFVLDSAAGSASSQYFTLLEGVREDLDLLASRNRLTYPDGWGIGMLETGDPATIERQLEALDVLDRVVRLAVQAGVTRITTILIKLDPAFGSRQGLGQVERTSVNLSFATGSESMTRLLVLTQTATADRVPLTIEKFEIKGERYKHDAVKADFTFLVVRLHDLPGSEEEE